MIGLILDALIVISLVGLALQAINAASLFRAILHFVVLGLAMSLAWARLDAPDLAMAEAAIGAGVTGALMMIAYRRLVELKPEGEPARTTQRSKLALPIAVASGLLVGMIGLAASLTEHRPGLAGLAVLETMDATGLGNPITGVLLIFRGFDTLLEITVLLAALLGAQAVTQRPDPDPSLTTQDPTTPLVGALLAIVVPLTVLVSVHLLKAGSSDTGGAFQAGAVLAASGVLLILTGRVEASDRPVVLLNLGLVAGLVSFILLGLAPLLQGGTLLALPGIGAIYFLESAMTLSIALTLVLLFAGATGLKRGRHG
ncbi:MAG: hydrogenase subunit MbhD domain-containing protein [Wenzhouxiangella sp.]|jgi:multisubunit Na+/H+ antiporter MnhB subunit|nr:hydrogenase subunit MbhD domain-containing protein [Wenzhouxiangella sp.]